MWSNIINFQQLLSCTLDFLDRTNFKDAAWNRSNSPSATLVFKRTLGFFWQNVA